MPIRKIKNPRNFEICRVCSHPYLAHTAEDWKPENCHRVVDNDTMKYKPCKCKGFKPKDNLEFLEWEYNGKLDKKFSN
jgi:hypothetical protein